MIDKIIEIVKNISEHNFISESALFDAADKYNLNDVEFSTLCEKITSEGISIIPDSEFKALMSQTDAVGENGNSEQNSNDNEEFKDVFDAFSRLTPIQINRCLQLFNEKYSYKLNSVKTVTCVEKPDIPKSVNTSISYKVEDLLYFSAKNCNGTGRMLNNGRFILYKGANLSPIFWESARNDFSIARKRYESIIIDNITTEDITFKSSSGAAKFICGYSVNGKITWKNQYGKTLKELLGE